MKYNSFPKIDFQISELAFGCMSLAPQQPQSEQLLQQAFESGINFFDTADLYDKGENERTLGNALKGKRSQVHISTKVGNKWRPDGSGWDWCARKDYILESVNHSLKRLQTDYIDLYLLHGGMISDPIDEVIDAFERLRESGKIRAYGISSIRPNVVREYVNRGDMAAVMTQYSVLDRRPEEEILSLLKQNGIGVLARGALATGLLVNKPPKEYLDFSEKEIQNRVLHFQECLPLGFAPDQAALRYVMDQQGVTAAVAGIRTDSQLERALSATGLEKLSLEQRGTMEFGVANKYSQHR